jgi:hypothetical protein
MYVRNRDARLLPEVLQRRDLGLGLEARHEAARDAGHNLVARGEGDEVCLAPSNNE